MGGILIPAKIKTISIALNKIAEFTKEDLINETFELEHGVEAYQQKQYQPEEALDTEAFQLRVSQYKEFLSDNKYTTREICEALKITEDIFIKEVHLMACLYPGSVLFKFVSPIIKSSFQKQKQIDAILYLQETEEELTINIICEKLAVDDRVAQQIINMNKLPAVKNNASLTFIEFINDIGLHGKLIKYFQMNPYDDVKNAIKELKIKISPVILKNGLEALIDRGYKIPCIAHQDAMQIEQLYMDIVEYKQKNPYATPKLLGRKFGLSENQIIMVIEQTAEEWKKEKIRSYEFYFKGVLEELDEISSFCYDRFHATPNSSSRWLEIAQNNTEKKIKLLGLNAPTEINIQQRVQIETKEEKDAIIEAFMATDMIDVSPAKKQSHV